MKKSHLHPPTLVLLPRADTTNSFLLHPCWKTSAHTQKHVYKSLKHRHRPCCPAPFFSPLTSPEIFLKEQIQMDSETNLAQVPGQKRFSCVLSVPESGPHVEELTLPLGSIRDHQSIVAPSQTLSVVDLFFPTTSEPPLGSLSPPVRLTHGEHPLAIPCQVSRSRVPTSVPYLFLRLQEASVSLPGVAGMVPASTTQCKRQHGAAKR